ncbi:DUF4238 domain-containing protein [Paraeggerthella sp. LCP19S3_G8]|uniref:DUF4238 domain-containing protein n=1 Tax=Paraeggerthella sp. LCP19S3_G8 TaxID=3440248 RepID=UPI003F9ADFF0
MSKLPGKMMRKQHWVPQFYLRHFADSSGRLRVYKRSADIYFYTKVENVCSKRDLYEVKYSDIEADSADKYYAQNLIESKLSEDESRISVPYSRLLQCCKDATLEGDAFRRGRQAVCKLASSLIVRHPVAMLDGRSRAREESSLLQADGILTEEDSALLNWSGWKGGRKALTELSVAATMLFSEDGSVPANRIREAFFEKHFCILEAPIGSGFVTTSMPMFIIGPEDDSYDFDFAYMPLSSEYAALFTTDSSLESFYRLDFPHVELMNRLLLLNCKHWSVALSSGNGPLEHAVRDWAKTASN